MLQNGPLRFPPFHFGADPDPVLHFDPDPALHLDPDPAFHLDGDQDPAYKNDAHPEPQYCLRATEEFTEWMF